MRPARICTGPRAMCVHRSGRGFCPSIFHNLHGRHLPVFPAWQFFYRPPSGGRADAPRRRIARIGNKVASNMQYMTKHFTIHKIRCEVIVLFDELAVVVQGAVWRATLKHAHDGDHSTGKTTHGRTSNSGSAGVSRSGSRRGSRRSSL